MFLEPRHFWCKISPLGGTDCIGWCTMHRLRNQLHNANKPLCTCMQFNMYITPCPIAHKR